MAGLRHKLSESQIYNQEEELARFTLTMSVKETGAVLALLRRTPSGWVLGRISATSSSSVSSFPPPFTIRIPTGSLRRAGSTRSTTRKVSPALGMSVQYWAFTSYCG